jgi:hypothetical protein
LNNNGNGTVFAVGIVAIIMIIIGALFPFLNEQKTGLILTGIAVLLFLVAGAVFSSSWQIGLVVSVIGIIAFFFGVHSFLTEPSSKVTSLLPMINQLLLL